ncbi:PEP-CTERM sorting domain-containing protein [Azohydromonas australica]|uniref:PEP-CTERM sorting domain-containing protein n=1 Tax=Azohydromonas australica TaxID=364039 RepID=UPI00048D0E7C|nr:PEP-CTERM sorting domain-containing protein [Azohydromonas australica]
MSRMQTLAKHCAAALLVSAAIPSYALEGTIEFAGALIFFNDTLKISNLDGFTITPVGFRNDDFPVPTGSTGEVKDISLATPGRVNVPGFLTFNAAPFARFDLTGIQAGIFDSSACGAIAAAGQTCTPAGSAVNFVNVPFGPTTLGSTMTFSVTGYMTDTRDGSRTPYAGHFAAVFPLEYQGFLGRPDAGGATFSAVFAQPVPEPASWLLMAGGLAVLGRYSRKRLSKAPA